MADKFPRMDLPAVALTSSVDWHLSRKDQVLLAAAFNQRFPTNTLVIARAMDNAHNHIVRFFVMSGLCVGRFGFVGSNLSGIEPMEDYNDSTTLPEMRSFVEGFCESFRWEKIHRDMNCEAL